MTKRKWTTDEDGRLKEMVLSGASLFEIADALDRSPMAVILRTRSLSGLEGSNTRRQMPDDYYDPTKTISQAAKNRMRKWSPADNYYLQEQFAKGKTIYDLAVHFDRTPTAIIKQLEKLNPKPADMVALFDMPRKMLKMRRVNTSPIQPKVIETPYKSELEGENSLPGAVTSLAPPCNAPKTDEILEHLLSVLELLDNDIDGHDRKLIEDKLLEYV